MEGMVPTVDIYLKSLPPARREIISGLRETILKALPKGYQEGMEYGMIAYYVPLSHYPKTYNGQPLGYVSIASHKDYISLYLMGIYGEGEIEFKRSYKKTGKKLDMGKSCIRFTSLNDLPLDLIAKTIAQYNPDEFIALYERGRG
jgi:hypothetical protein